MEGEENEEKGVGGGWRRDQIKSISKRKETMKLIEENNKIENTEIILKTNETTAIFLKNKIDKPLSRLIIKN